MAGVVVTLRTFGSLWDTVVARQKRSRRWNSCRCILSQNRSFDKLGSGRNTEISTAKKNPLQPYPAVSSGVHRLSSTMLSAPPPAQRLWQLPASDQAFLLLVSIALMVSGSLAALLVTAIPTLNAMRRAAISLEKLAESARKELPSTMAAIRLSGMEISDLTLELSDMSQEISETVKSSARALRAAELGLRRTGSLAASQTLSILQERASGPVEAVKPVVASAAENTWQAVTQARQAVSGLTSLPILLSWIRKKNREEESKIEEAMEETTSSQEHNCLQVHSGTTMSEESQQATDEKTATDS